MRKLQNINYNTIEEWDNIYSKDVGNHAWGGTWSIVDSMTEGCLDIFDYGCGMGYYLSHLKTMGKNVSGYERSIVAISNIKKRDPNLKVSNKLPNKKVECTLCMEVLEHASNAIKLIKYLVSITEYKLIITVPNVAGGKYHINLFEEKDFNKIFNKYIVNQIIVNPPWGSEKRIVEVYL
jgi:hypothetical protein